jgi:hypothetical protein
MRKSNEYYLSCSVEVFTGAIVVIEGVAGVISLAGSFKAESKLLSNESAVRLATTSICSLLSAAGPQEQSNIRNDAMVISVFFISYFSDY